MKDLLKKYKFGIDYWGLGLFALLMLPNIVYWCVPQFGGLGGDKPIDIAANVFQVIAVALLIFIVHKERRKPSLSHPLVYLAALFLLVYYIAWIFYFVDYFVGYWNYAVVLFLAVCPCVSLVLYETEAKNYPALLPTAVFAILHILSAILQIV